MTVTTLLDSGTRMSLIDNNLLEQILPGAHRLLSTNLCQYSHIIGVTGDEKAVEGCIDLNMIIGHIQCSQLFHVIKNLQPKCILGRDFLRHYECVLDFTTQTIRSTKLTQLCMESTIQVPAHATTICRANIFDNRHYIMGTVMEVFAKPL